MKSRFWKATSALALGLMLVLSLGRGAMAQSAETHASPTLHGTWIVAVQIRNCQTGAPLGMPFRSLLSFAAGGTVTETTENPMFYPALRGPGHGIWSRTGSHNFKASTTAFIALNGSLVKTQRIGQNIEISTDPNQFTTTSAVVEFFDPDGNLIQKGCASAVGVRYRFQ
ncbi:MAG: hypothetical protein ABI383_09525 [Acidobacteriaceae bacterium]